MRAEQVISGATRMVASRARRLEMTRVAMMPGMAQAKLDNSGMKARPCSPAPPMIRSIKKGRPSHIAEILEQQDEEEQSQDLRQEGEGRISSRFPVGREKTRSDTRKSPLRRQKISENQYLGW